MQRVICQADKLAEVASEGRVPQPRKRMLISRNRRVSKIQLAMRKDCVKMNLLGNDRSKEELLARADADRIYPYLYSIRDQAPVFCTPTSGQR